MKYKLHIAYCNRPDLTAEAIESLRDIGNIHLWPNNGAPALPAEVFRNGDIETHRLPDLSPVCVINMMLQSSWDDDVCFWAHNDCFAHPGIAAKFKTEVERKLASDDKWGVYFTLYDILCAFNMKAVRDTGYWDPMYFQYTADPDYYKSLTVRGWSCDTWMPGRESNAVEHRGSMTIRSDALFNRRIQWREKTRFDKQYYALKWGGLPGSDPFIRPFQDFKPIPATRPS